MINIKYQISLLILAVTCFSALESQADERIATIEMDGNVQPVTVSNLQLRSYTDMDYLPICWRGSHARLSLSEVKQIEYLEPGKYHFSSSKYDNCTGYRIKVGFLDNKTDEVMLRTKTKNKKGVGHLVYYTGDGKYGEWKIKIGQVRKIIFDEKQ